MRFIPLSTLLLPGLLTAYSGYAQGSVLYQPPIYQQQARAPLSPPNQYQNPRYQASRQILVAPTIPIDTDGALKQEPDSATRRQYARHRVRNVLKTRLDKQGLVQDTVEYLTVDDQGRWTEVGRWQGQVHRQWSYNSNGQCTALVEHPYSARPYTVISTYNPALGRGHQEVLLRDGTHTLVQEKQLYQNGDTLLTEIKAHELVVGNYRYPRYLQHSLRLVPHPDTLLSLTCFYDENQRPSSYQFDYLLYQRGRLLETGKINSSKISSTGKDTGVEMMGPAKALAALRRGTWLQPQERRFYDSRHRLIRQEFTRAKDLRAARSVIQYTYNNLGQLIGRENSYAGTGVRINSTYTVFSYSPTGLLTGETTNTGNGNPVFYRYQYQYYD